MPIATDTPNRRRTDGLAQELASLTTAMARTLIELKTTLTNTTGDPARSKRLSRTDTLARLDAYEDPQRRADLANVSDGDLAQLTRQAITLRRGAMRAGQWSPPQPMPTTSPDPETLAVPSSLPSPNASIVDQPQGAPPDQLVGLGVLPSATQ